MSIDDKEFIVVTEKGVMANHIPGQEITPWLLHAFLQVWSDREFEVDIVETAEEIIDLLFSKREEKDRTLEDVLKSIFSDDESNG